MSSDNLKKNGEPSTSSQPLRTIPSESLPPSILDPIQTDYFETLDPALIKQELHDVLGVNGLPYWKAMNGYLLGQLGRAEVLDMIRDFLKGKDLTLHNRLLMSLLQSASDSSSLSPGALLRKRRRAGEQDGFDMDDTHIEPSTRVQTWLSGITARDRVRIRRTVLGQDKENGVNEDGDGDGASTNGISKNKRNPFSQAILPRLAPSQRLLPSSIQLYQRLSTLAQASGLTLAPEGEHDIGEFMAVSMDAHLSDVLHSLVHLTGRNTPGTIRLGRKRRRSHSSNEVTPEPFVDGYIPKPDLSSLQSLFTLAPGLHPQASPALYKLSSSLAESQKENQAGGVDGVYTGGKTARRTDGMKSPDRSFSGNTQDAKVAELAEKGLLKVDKAGRQSEAGEEGGKKAKKHTLHWLYEDPALILKDVMG
ncbi:hypothetical protein M231_01152 [Tremella mesenterica]|uniref:Transcriptional coactivator HFI1/ADA1 n=1 Tax=Tremella mesenterica TaxID=5217 RepID=A0A4Q1BUJ1_TREME|nr:hypothetical protein M231_01152 [Tremella mesenterica]